MDTIFAGFGIVILVTFVADGLRHEAATESFQMRQMIWNASDVELKEVEGSSFTVGPFPAFVELLYKHKSLPLVQKCGGTLVQRRFILTAGHCVKHDPHEYELHAYLNPYMNPATLETALLDESPEVWNKLMRGSGSEYWVPGARKEQISAFQAGMARGLGTLLEVQVPLPGAIHFGTLHPDYGEKLSLFEAMTNDVAIIPLREPPFPEDSNLWDLFEVQFPQPGAHPSTAMAYGNGLVGQEKQTCGFKYLDNCFLQQKSLKILSVDECEYYFVHLMNHRLKEDWIRIKLSLEKEGIPLQEAHKLTQEVTSNFVSFFTNATEKDIEHKLRDSVHRSKLVSDLLHLGRELAAVKRGSQICILSEDGTGNVQSGDSGGPLVDADGRLIGVGSWALGATSGNSIPGLTTLASKFPSFFTSTDYFRSWIESVTQ